MKKENNFSNELISSHGFANVFNHLQTGQFALHSNKRFLPGEIIEHFSAAETFENPSRYTVQVSDKKHILLNPEFLQFINHSCSPNVFFDTEKKQLECLEEINPGDEFRFFYPSTEWEMDEPFHCNCGSESCLQTIKGAKFIEPDKVHQFKFNRFILEKMETEKVAVKLV